MRVWWTLWGDFGVHSGNTPDLDMIFGYEIKYSALQHLGLMTRGVMCVLWAFCGLPWALIGRLWASFLRSRTLIG